VGTIFLMRRKIEEELKIWKDSKKPKPLLLRGARQVGKTFTVEKFGKESFENLIVINFEEDASFISIFENELDPEKILQKIKLRFKKEIQCSTTLIFLDEIQLCPRAIQAMRFFYEKLPGLHIIGAGSLLEFALRSGEISIPVGRVKYLFMRPLSFEEFLEVRNNYQALEFINKLSLKDPLDDQIHEELLKEFRLYALIGGMPGLVQEYLDTEDIFSVGQEQIDLMNTYKDDFSKYSKNKENFYMNILLKKLPSLLGTKFKYSKIDPEIRTEYLKEAVFLLEKSQLIHRIRRASGAGLPFESHSSEKDFKLIFLDIGIANSFLDLFKDLTESENLENLASGALAEQIVGQELAAYQSPYKKSELYYWERDGKESSAEVDYLFSYLGQIYGIEVKAGKTGKLKSLYQFIKKYNSAFGIRISSQRLGFERDILSVPFYGIKVLGTLIGELGACRL
jgi:uncharacterized protein